MAYETVKSVEKAFAILEVLTSQSMHNAPLSLAEIARQTGLLPVTARNLLRTMEECGYAKRTGHGKYREGDRCVRLFRMEGVLRRLEEVAEPIIRRMVQDLGESVLLASLIHNRRVELLRCQTEDDPMVEPHWSANENFYQMRTTRVVLAWFSEAQRTSFLAAHGLPRKQDWPECEVTTAGLIRELSRIRREGGCLDVHNVYYAMAVPILTADNQVVASLGCYAPVSRTDLPRATGIFQMLHTCAGRIRDEMTGGDPL